MTVAKRAADWLEKISVGLVLLGIAGDGIWQANTIQGTACLVSGLFWACVCFWLTHRNARVKWG